MGEVLLAVFVIALIGFIASYIVRRRTNKQIAVFNRAHDLDFVCAPYSTVVNNISEVDEAVELHIICCVYCMLELEKNPARLDVMKMSEGTKELLRSVILPEDEPDEPASP